MSSSRKNRQSGTSNNDAGKGRSVHFAAEVDTTDPPAAKRRRMANDSNAAIIDTINTTTREDDDNYKDRKPAAAHTKKNKKKKYYQNEDELDDIDDWDDDEDNDGVNDGDGIVPSEKELMEAKRKRRQKRGRLGGFDDDNDDDNDDHEMGDEEEEGERSLKTEGIKFEPFHMREEEEDGTGYFDGDTYVFRRNPGGEDGEPDAWVDALNDQEENDNQSAPSISKPEPEALSSPQENLDDLTKEQLYSRILPLMSGIESVTKAIQRYGKIVKHEQKQRRQAKKNSGGVLPLSSPDEQPTAVSMAKSCLDSLTGAANALLLQGDVDIYQTTRHAILRRFPNASGGVSTHFPVAAADTTATNFATSTSSTTPATDVPASSSKVQWEYMGNQDNKIHGPFTTEQMLRWVEAGYFVGAQRVKIRTIREAQLSTEDDLLADLMDDDDDDDDGSGKERGTKGDWMWSNEINYKTYL